jgi:hypothetical protein
VKRGRRRKAGRPSLLTPALTRKICSMIIAGAYDYAAAEACGISKDTFREWMARGEGQDKDRESRTKYAAFAASVRLARSQARVGAELLVKKIDPKWWLSRMHRDRPGEPGWTGGEHIEDEVGPPTGDPIRQTGQVVGVFAAALELMSQYRVTPALSTWSARPP